MSQQGDMRAVRTPAGRLAGSMRRRFLPAVVWLAAVAAAVILAQRQGRYIDGTGTVEVNEVAVSPLIDGKVQQLSVDLFQQVEAGQVIAVMDDARASAELGACQADLAKLKTQLTSAVSDLPSIREQIRIQEARVLKAQERLALLTLKAPVAGRVAALHHRAGETVSAAEPIVTIANTDSQRVVAYVDEAFAHDVKEFKDVKLSSWRHPHEMLTAKVLEIGPCVEEIPRDLWRSPSAAQRGLPLLVGEIPSGAFLPGERIHVRFLRN